MNEKLTDFYEGKYQADKENRELRLIPYAKYPADRYEACIKYFVDSFRGKRILELGAGDGLITKNMLLSLPSVSEYVASELSENRLMSIRNSVNDSRLSTIRIDVENFDFNTLGKFDAVIMVALIEHLIDPIQAMKNIRQTLHPGGFVYIDTPNVADYGCRFKLMRGKFPSTASRNEGLITYEGDEVTLFDEGHLHYFTYNSLSQMLLRYCGYKRTEKYYYPVGKLWFGKAFHYRLARWWPEMFSMLALLAE